MSTNKTEEGKEKIRRRLNYILQQQQQHQGPSSSSETTNKFITGKSSNNKQNDKDNKDRPLTETEQEEFTIQMLKENDEMKKAFVTSYYVIQALLGFWAAYLLMANIETPWSKEAFHLGPLRLVLEAKDVNLALGFIIISMILCALASFIQSLPLLRAALIMCVYPFLRVGAVFFETIEVPLGPSSQAIYGETTQKVSFFFPFWTLIWLPLAAPIIIGIQMVVMKLFKDMDDQVISFYHKNKIPLKGV